MQSNLTCRDAARGTTYIGIISVYVSTRSALCGFSPPSLTILLQSGSPNHAGPNPQLDEHLDRLKQTIGDIENDMADVRQARNMAPVINQLPLELLIRILDQSLESARRLDDAQTLSSVCRSWKHIIDHTPSIWSSINCHHHRLPRADSKGDSAFYTPPHPPRVLEYCCWRRGNESTIFSKGDSRSYCNVNDLRVVKSNPATHSSSRDALAMTEVYGEQPGPVPHDRPLSSQRVNIRRTLP